MIGAPVQVTVDPPPRGDGVQTPVKFAAQSFRGSFAWGGAPGEASIVYVSTPVTTGGIAAGALVSLQLGGHYFSGICVSDTGKNGAHGANRELLFRDLREFLTWDYTFCTFNIPDRKLVNNVWKKRYWHIYPWDWDTQTKTFTDFPLPAWQMVNAILLGPTIGSPWSWDFTGKGLFPDGLLNAPVFNFDAINGKRLDAALNEISAAGGLVYTLDAQPHDNYQLVWMRKGFGLVPIFPENSDERRGGVSLSGNATNVRVVGDRNKYQVLNLDMNPDWLAAWEQFLVMDELAQDLYQNEKDPATGKSYSQFPDDPEHWKGAYAAKIRALEITVAEYATLRDARASADGNQFRDFRKFAGRSRMDMPAALYLQNLVFRAFSPASGNTDRHGNFIPGIWNNDGKFIPLSSLLVADQMLCRVTYDPVSGLMEHDPSQLSDGNGLMLLKGWQFGQDFFKLVNPERITENFFTADRYWTSASFQIDDSSDSGLTGDRFIILDAPAFTSENLLATIDGMTVLNARFTLAAPTMKAALTFEAERFSFWKGTFPSVSRDRAEYISGLFKEFSGAPIFDGHGNVIGGYTELLFADGDTANNQAARVAESLLQCQYLYAAGGYQLKWKPKTPASKFATPLSTIIDRVEIASGPDGLIEVVDWTTERQRDYFEPERDLERRTLQNTLFPGQAELKTTALDYKRFAGAIKGMPRDVFNLFMQFLTGNFDNSTMVEVRIDQGNSLFFDPTDLIDAGTPFFKKPTTPAAGGSTANTGTLVTYPPDVDPLKDTVFAGVTVRDKESAAKSFYVQNGGETLALVQGPLGENDPIGIDPNGYSAFANDGAYLVKSGNSVGIALQKISDSNIHLIKVRLTGTSSSGDPVWLP